MDSSGGIRFYLPHVLCKASPISQAQTENTQIVWEHMRQTVGSHILQDFFTSKKKYAKSILSRTYLSVFFCLSLPFIFFFCTVVKHSSFFMFKIICFIHYNQKKLLEKTLIMYVTLTVILSTYILLYRSGLKIYNVHYI